MLISVLRDAVRGWNDDRASRLAAALAFFTAFAFAPLLIVIVEIAALALGGAGHHQVVRDQMLAALKPSLGDNGAKAVGDIVQSTFAQRKSGAIAGAISWATFILAATGLFGSIQDALDTVFHVEPKGGGILAMVRERFTSFAVLAGIAFVLLASFVVNSGIVAFDRVIAEKLPSGHLAIVALSAVVTVVVVVALFAVIYKVLPRVDLDWRDVGFGAVITAMLFLLGQYAIGWYLGHASTTSTYGAAGSFAALLLWFYYSGQIFLFGAEITKSYANARRSRTGGGGADVSV